MDQLFANGQIVWIVIGFVALEAAALLAYGRHSSRGPAAVDVIALLLPGLCLLLALQAALAGSRWSAIAGWLLASLVAHLFDLWRRFGSR